MEDFNFFQSGALLALNTFGPFLLSAASLPLVCPSLLPPHQPAKSREESDGDHSIQFSRSGTQHSSDDGSCRVDVRWHTQQQPQPPDCKQRGARLRAEMCAAALAFVTARTLNAAVATACAAVLRRHLMVWALFAPKFLFDACILLVCDAAILTSSALALTAVNANATVVCGRCG